MKKILSYALILALLFSVVACQTDNGDDPGDDDVVGEAEASFEREEPQDTGDLPKYKIAFTYYFFEDKLGGQFRESIRYLADAFNVDAVFFESGTGDEQISNWESVLTAGDIDGVITVGVTPALMEVAKRYDVPVVTACGFPSVADEISGTAAYDNFLGGVIDDDYWAGYRTIEALYDAGARNFVFSGLTIGMVKSHDDRMNAMKDFVAEHSDMELLADSYTLGEGASDVPTFNASFPELEAMAFSAIGDGVYSAIETEGLVGEIKLSGVDISSQTGTYFKNGTQVWTCGGQYATAMVGFAVLYNYLADGTRIIENTAEPIVRKYIEITSYDDYKQYVEYVESEVPTYTADEIAQMIHYFNPDVTIDDYLEDAEAYSLEDIIERRS